MLNQLEKAPIEKSLPTKLLTNVFAYKNCRNQLSLYRVAIKSILKHITNDKLRWKQ